MKIVIVGGTGFLGSEFIKSKIDTDDEIILFTRKEEKNYHKIKKNLGRDLTLVTWNPYEQGKWISQLENADVVVNFAGLGLDTGIRWTKGLKKKFFDSRVKTTQNVVEGIKSLQQKPRHYIQVSGINCYQYSKSVQDESAKLADTFLANLCKDWEEASKPLNSAGIPRLIIRLAPVLSKKSQIIKLMLLPYKLFAGGRYGLRGDQYFSWVHIDDFVRFVNFAIDNKTSGVVNLSAPQPIMNKDMNRIIGKTMKRPWFIPVPSFVLMIALGEKSDLLLKSLNVVSSRLPELGFSFTYEEFSEAFKNL